MATSKPSTQDQPTLSPAVFPASRSVALGSAEARRTTATSGRTCLESYESRLPAGSSVRMLVASLLGTKEWYSTKCALTWRLKVTKSGRLLFQLLPSTPLTGATGFGLLPTAAARDYKGTNSAKHLAKKRGHHDQLPNFIAMLPTPQADDADNVFPSDKRRKTLVSAVVGPSGARTGLKLQPAFALWMMGYPAGWLDLEDGEMPRSRAQAMRLSRKLQQKSLKQLGK